jgi:YVTN family beta-propeller protein
MHWLSRLTGQTLLAAAGEARGVLLAINTADGKIKQSIPIGHTPMGVAIVGDMAYAVNRFSNDLMAIDLKAGKVTKTVPAGREPHGIAVADGGRKLFVSNHQPMGPADGDYIAIGVCPFALPDLTPLPHIKLTNGSAVGRKITASPDGGIRLSHPRLGKVPVADHPAGTRLDEHQCLDHH